ncbi:hypothetical protein, partial [Pseudodonghicola flavimaris]
MTLTENPDGSITMEFTQVGVGGADIGDFSRLYFDVNEELLGTLSITGALEDGHDPIESIESGDDSVDPGLNPLPIEGGGFDYGITLDAPPDLHDDYATVTLTISSSLRDLSLNDFAEQQFGVRIQSIGPDADGDGDGDGGGSDKQVGTSPKLYEISGVKYIDQDGDGSQDASDPGLAGIRIFIDADNDGVFDADEKSALTAADGSWTISAITQDEWDDPDAVVREDVGSSYVIVEGANGYELGSVESYDFGNFEKFDISGVKFEDLDGDGVRDAGDPGWAGVVIKLLDADDN